MIENLQEFPIDMGFAYAIFDLPLFVLLKFFQEGIDGYKKAEKTYDWIGKKWRWFTPGKKAVYFAKLDDRSSIVWMPRELNDLIKLTSEINHMRIACIDFF